ncbi:class I SAM-dependent methyltransferase [Catenovulum agarivorans]|uniref:class I SAM-dependent methyltransferase n=1 Tax=Catenovulum agarivorans TaxID=1172192 RepID=UPI00058E6B9C|nr:class I SAM-dependent methyltransferase [Catenovulum agarivorans]
MSTEIENCSCPLCCSLDTHFYHQDKLRSYLQCSHCKLVFVPQQFHLSAQAEKAEYDKHDNSYADQGYQRFLSRTWTPLKTRLKRQFTEAIQGLDFGCGEGAVLSKMAQADGFNMRNYDLYYFPQTEVLQQKYQFISATEVIEHIADAHNVWLLLDRLLDQKGVLAVMTKRVLRAQAFANWHYKNDLTHVCFYSEFTFAYLASKFNWTFEIIDKDVVFLIKA